MYPGFVFFYFHNISEFPGLARFESEKIILDTIDDIKTERTQSADDTFAELLGNLGIQKSFI